MTARARPGVTALTDAELERFHCGSGVRPTVFEITEAFGELRAARSCIAVLRSYFALPDVSLHPSERATVQAALDRYDARHNEDGARRRKGGR